MFGFIALIAILLMIGACFWFYTSFQRSGPLDKETVLITVGKKPLDKELVPEPALSTKYLEYVR